jgi:hypothetical protein
MRKFLEKHPNLNEMRGIRHSSRERDSVVDIPDESNLPISERRRNYSPTHRPHQSELFRSTSPPPPVLEKVAMRSKKHDTRQVQFDSSNSNTASEPID